MILSFFFYILITIIIDYNLQGEATGSSDRCHKNEKGGQGDFDWSYFDAGTKTQTKNDLID